MVVRIMDGETEQDALEREGKELLKTIGHHEKDRAELDPRLAEDIIRLKESDRVIAALKGELKINEKRLSAITASKERALLF